MKKIKWVEGNSKGSEKLYDNNASNERYKIKSGEIEDQSQPFGASNIEVSDGPLIGR